MTSVVRQVFIDNEGCTIPGKGQPFALADLLVLDRVFEWFSRRVALSTGRSVGYVEAMTQVLGLTRSEVPCVCEGGAVLYWPACDKPELLAKPIDRESFFTILDEDKYREEPGKLACLSLYPKKGCTVELLEQEVAKHPRAEQYHITTSEAAVDITDSGVDKASGVIAACHAIDAEPEETLCIGDSDNDLPMLETVGFVACPANANKKVKQLVERRGGLVSTLPDTRGITDILLRFAPMFKAPESSR